MKESVGYATAQGAKSSLLWNVVDKLVDKLFSWASLFFLREKYLAHLTLLLFRVVFFDNYLASDNVEMAWSYNWAFEMSKKAIRFFTSVLCLIRHFNLVFSYLSKPRIFGPFIFAVNVPNELTIFHLTNDKFDLSKTPQLKAESSFAASFFFHRIFFQTPGRLEKADWFFWQIKSPVAWSYCFNMIRRSICQKMDRWRADLLKRKWGFFLF